MKNERILADSKEDLVDNTEAEVAATESETKDSDQESFDDSDERARAFGEMLLGAIQGVESGENKQRVDISGEYSKDCLSENREFLESVHAPRYLVETYTQLMEEYPVLRSIRLSQMPHGIMNAFFTNTGKADSDPSSYVPMIRYNFSNPEVYMSKKHDVTRELRGLDFVSMKIAYRMGANGYEVLSNPQLVESFVLLHEFGHAYDFIMDYLRPAYEELTKSGWKGDMKKEAIRRAIIMSGKDRREDLTQLTHGSIKAESDAELESIIHSRLKNMDANPRDAHEMSLLRGRSYRSVRSEAFADDFALDFIAKHRDKFFYGSKSGEVSKGRVRQSDSYMSVAGEMLPGLELDPGMHLEGEYHTVKGRTIPLSGYLNGRVRIGKPLEISLNGNSKDGEVGVSDAAVSQVAVRSRKNGDSFIIVFENGASYHCQTTRGEGAPQIELSGKEVEKELGVRPGDEIALLKVNLQRKSNIDAGRLLRGRLDNELTKGHAIILDQGEGKVGSVSNVEKFYREWNQYYAKTATSVYEILPIRK